MAKTTLSDIAKVLNQDNGSKDFHYYGTVISEDEDEGTYEVSINSSATPVTAAKLVGAKVGDTVMVTVMSNGYTTVTGCLGGDKDAADAKKEAKEAKEAVVDKMQSNWDQKLDTEPDFILNKPPIKKGPAENSIIESDLINNNAGGDYSHAEGYMTNTVGGGSHAEGIRTDAIGYSSHAEGYETTAEGDYTHAEGYKTKATEYGWAAHVEGRETTANGDFSHAEGQETVTGGDASHAEGYKTNAYHYYSHAEGEGTKALAKGAHAEGYGTTAEGEYSHAEGYLTKATGMGSHAGGWRGEAKGAYSFSHGDAAHAEGVSSVAFSMGSAEGSLSTAFANGNAKGDGSFAWGSMAEAIGEDSMALGDHCKTQYANQIAIGQYNRLGSAKDDQSKKCIFIVGTGARQVGDPARNDALALTKDGDLHIAGHVYEESLDHGALTGYRLLNTQAFSYYDTVFYTQESSDQSHPGLKVYINYDDLREHIIEATSGVYMNGKFISADINYIAERLNERWGMEGLLEEVTTLNTTISNIQQTIDGLIGG